MGDRCPGHPTQNPCVHQRLRFLDQAGFYCNSAVQHLHWQHESWNHRIRSQYDGCMYCVLSCCFGLQDDGPSYPAYFSLDCNGDQVPVYRPCASLYEAPLSGSVPRRPKTTTNGMSCLLWVQFLPKQAVTNSSTWAVRTGYLIYPASRLPLSELSWAPVQ